MAASHRGAPTSTAGRVLVAALLMATLFATAVNAQASTSSETPKFTPDEIIFGVCCMLTGIYLCFFGYRIIRVLVFLTGFYVGYWLCFSIMSNINVDYGSSEEWVIFGASVGAGLVIGLILMCLLPVGIFLLGALTGFMMSLWILSLVDPSSPLVTVTEYKWLFICGLALVMGILAVIFQKVIIILGSSYVGAYLLFYGIDIFAETGFYQASQDLVRGEELSQCSDTACIMMLCGCVVCAIIGVIFQFYSNRDRDHTKPNNNVYVKIN